MDDYVKNNIKEWDYRQKVMDNKRKNAMRRTHHFEIWQFVLKSIASRVVVANILTEFIRRVLIPLCFSTTK